MARFKKLDKISAWRRVAAAMWGEARSPLNLGFDDIDFTLMHEVIGAQAMYGGPAEHPRVSLIQ